MAPSEPTEAPLAPHEVEQANALVAEARWNQVAADWELFLAAGRVHTLREGGRLAATAAVLPYQGFGWISMVLVASAFRRRGFATRLLGRCIDDLAGAGLVPGLDATPAGRELYQRLGFHDSWEIRRLVLRAPTHVVPTVRAPPDVELRPLTDSDWPALLARDRQAFGADRGTILAQLRRRLGDAAWCATSRGRLVGYLLGRDGRVASQLGPLIADSDAIALALLARGLAAVRGPIYVDVLAERSAVRDWLEQAGFTVERPLTRMFRGRAASFGDARSVVAIAGPELG